MQDVRGSSPLPSTIKGYIVRCILFVLSAGYHFLKRAHRMVRLCYSVDTSKCSYFRQRTEPCKPDVKRLFYSEITQNHFLSPVSHRFAHRTKIQLIFSIFSRWRHAEMLFVPLHFSCIFIEILYSIYRYFSLFLPARKSVCPRQMTVFFLFFPFSLSRLQTVIFSASFLYLHLLCNMYTSVPRLLLLFSLAVQHLCIFIPEMNSTSHGQKTVRPL